MQLFFFSFGQGRLWSDCADAQSNLSLDGCTRPKIRIAVSAHMIRAFFSWYDTRYLNQTRTQFCPLKHRINIQFIHFKSTVNLHTVFSLNTRALYHLTIFVPNCEQVNFSTCWWAKNVMGANSVEQDQTPRSAASDLVYTVCPNT